MLIFSDAPFPSFSLRLWSLSLVSICVALVVGAMPGDRNRFGKSAKQVSFLEDTSLAPPVEQFQDDTTRSPAIEVKPCSIHATYRNREQMGPPYRPARQGVVPSLHEFTCRWAVGNDLSIDSTQLPMYVRPTGDSIRLGEDLLVYAVEMVQLKEEPTHTPHTLYFLAEIADSLYYKEIDDARPHSFTPSHIKVRSLRPLNVSDAQTQYIWFEYARSGEMRKDSTRTWEKWKAHIFTYDRRRGVRHLQWVPIRAEERKNGKLVGAKQWDVSVPEAGFMQVEKRLQKGKDLTLEPPEHWLGLHVIDSTAAGTESVRPSRD